jgi:hypothetical protein
VSLDKLQDYLFIHKYPNAAERNDEYNKMDVNIAEDEALNKLKCENPYPN